MLWGAKKNMKANFKIVCLSKWIGMPVSESVMGDLVMMTLCRKNWICRNSSGLKERKWNTLSKCQLLNANVRHPNQPMFTKFYLNTPRYKLESLACKFKYQSRGCRWKFGADICQVMWQLFTLCTCWMPYGRGMN